MEKKTTNYLSISKKEPAGKQFFCDEIVEGDETILLVDDEDIIIEVVTEMLESLGYQVLSVQSGKEAIAVYKKKVDIIDLIMLDMIMPDMGGKETFNRIKQLNPGVKVILASGYAINGHITEIMERGCKAFLQKPFSMQGLSQKIREVLDGE